MIGREVEASCSGRGGGVGNSDGNRPSHPGAGYKWTGKALSPPSGLQDRSVTTPQGFQVA